MNAHMLTLAALVAVGGQLSDLFDRRGTARFRRTAPLAEDEVE
jgi:hypothetical protein